MDNRKRTSSATSDAHKVLVYRTDIFHLSETFIREQALCLKKWTPKLVCRHVVADGLDLGGMDVLVLENSKSLVSKAINRIRTIIGWPSRRDVQLLKKEKAQLIHVHFATDAVSIWPWVKLLELPMIITLHGYDINTNKEWWESGKGGYWMRSYPKRLLGLSAQRNVHFIAVSEAIKVRAIEYGIPEAKLTVSYIGVDTDKFTVGPTPLNKRKKILYVGRLVEKKGCRYLLEAFHGIQREVSGFELVIVGSGALEDDLKNYAKVNGIRAKFLGPLSNDQVRNQLQDARVFCLPSITTENGNAEGLPIVVLEAQASGVPVITSARGGATEGILDGVSGFAHKEKDILAIQKALKYLITNDEMAQSFGLKARVFATEKMDVKKCSAKLETIYTQSVMRATQ